MARIKHPGRGWAYLGAISGGLVSIAANVAHSFLPPHHAPATWAPEPGAVVGAVVWPVFLFIAVEILARTAWPRGWSWQLLRWAGLLPVAGVAAFVSYRHLSGLLAHYGEEPIVYYIGPLAVDGLMIMATGALLAGGRAARTTAHGPIPSTAVLVQPTSPVHPVTPAPRPVPPPTVLPVPAAPPRPVEPVPVAAPNPAQVKARVDARKESGTSTVTTAPSSIDSSVTASDAGPRSSKLAPGQLARAQHVAEAHRSGTGAAITAGELAVRIRVSTERAYQLLAALDSAAGSPSRPAPRNGTPVTSTTR